MPKRKNADLLREIDHLRQRLEAKGDLLDEANKTIRDRDQAIGGLATENAGLQERQRKNDFLLACIKVLLTDKGEQACTPNHISIMTLIDQRDRL